MKTKRFIIAILVLILAASSVFAATKFTAADWNDYIGTGKTVKSVASDPVDVTITSSTGETSKGSIVLRFFRTKNGPALGFFITENGSKDPVEFGRKEATEIAIKLDYGRTIRIEPENMFDNCPLTVQENDMMRVYNQFKSCKFLDITIKSEDKGTKYTFHIEYDAGKFEKAVSAIIG